MMRMLYRILLLSWCIFLTSVAAYPIESKPLNENPESWNLSWLVFTPRAGNSSDPFAEPLVSSDPHVKKSKITPKSIFIAPSNYNTQDKICPHGYRIDDNGKCIKTVTINQDDILAARLSDLFGTDTSSSHKNSNVDSDYYDFDEDKNEDSGPLQINLPFALDVEEETEDGKKIEYIVEEKIITMRNHNPKNIKPEASEDYTTIVPAPVTEKLIADESIIVTSTTEIPSDEQQTTTTEEPLSTTSLIDTTIIPEITTTTTLPPPTTTPPTTTTTTSTTTTEKPPIIILPSKSTIEPYKINSVEFMPKITKRNRIKNGGKRVRRPRPQQQPQLNEESVQLKSQQLIDPLPIPKKNRVRVNTKRRKLVSTSSESPVTTTTTTTTTESPATRRPFYWLPKGWTIDESTKEKPVLIRFWGEQQQTHDERARSHNSRHQRVNSKMPTEGIFREITVPELEGEN